MLVEERVTNLEEVLAKFMEQSSVILAAIHEDIAEIRASNARTDHQLLEMQQQAERDRQQVEQERRDNAERFRQWDQRAEADRKAWEQRMAESDQRYEQDRKASEQRRAESDRRYEQDRKDFNKRLAEISDSMGTLIEDFVAPCGFQLARAIFATEEADTCAIRIKRRHPTSPGEMMEIDLLAVGPTKLLVIEVKRRMDAAKAAEYRQKLARLPEFFPELSHKAVHPAEASVYLEPSVIAFLNREKLYGIALGEDAMQVINLGQF